MGWRVRILTALIVVVFAAATWIYFRFYVVPPPHGVILFIAPGVSVAEIAGNLNGASSDPDAALPEVIDSTLIPTRGQSLLDSLSSLSTGLPEPAGTLGLRPDESTADNLAYQAQRAGRSIGLVTGDRFTHPAAAAFFAHTREPDNHPETIVQIMDSTKWNVLLGGHRAGLDPTYPRFGEEKPLPPSNSRNLVEEARLTGYRIVNLPGELDEVPRWRTRYLLGAFRFPDAFYDPESHSHSPVLRSMVTLAIECLQFSVGGYFLVAITTDVSAGPEANNPEFRRANLRHLGRSLRAACDYSDENAVILLFIPGKGETPGHAFLFRGKKPLPAVGSASTLHDYLSQIL